jgi:hypothetical protein
MALGSVGRFARIVAGRSLWPVKWALAAAATRLSERRKFTGFELVCLADHAEAQVAFRQLASALALIAQYDPKLLVRMRRNMPRILIVPPGGAHGRFWSFANGCAIDVHHAIRDPVPSVAMTLVHEATHARIHRNGIPYGLVTRMRIERACLRREIEFGSRVPGAEALVNEARSVRSSYT